MKNLLALIVSSTLFLAGCSSPAQEVEATQPVTTSVTQAPEESTQEESVEVSESAEPEVTEGSGDAEPTTAPDAQPAETSTPKASATKAPTPTKSPTKTPTKTPSPTPSETASTTGYTKAQVAEKNSRSNCWVIVNDSVYNLTDWITKHPGGSGSILSFCGGDATSAFEGKHGGEARPSSILESYYLGPLTK